MLAIIQTSFLDSDFFRWHIGDSIDHCQSFSGNLEQLAAAAQQEDALQQVVLVISSLDCIFKTIPFAQQERKHIVKALPFLLEESILSDVDGLQLVNAKPAAAKVELAATDAEQLQKLLARLSTIGITPTLCIPEQALVMPMLHLIQPTETAEPQSERQNTAVSNSADIDAAIDAGSDAGIGAEALYCIVLDDSALLVDADAVYPVDHDHITLAISQYAQQPGLQGHALHILAQDSQLDLAHSLYNSLDTELKDHGNTSEPALQLSLQSFNYAKLIASFIVTQSPLQQATAIRPFNFLQGQFAQSLNWFSMLKPWRFVLLFAAVVYLAQMLFLSVHNTQIEQQLLAQRAEMDAIFRQAIPRGNIVDHQKQLQRKLQQLSQNGSGQQFIGWLNRAGQVLADAEVEQLNSLLYDAKTSTMRLDFLVQDYDRLQTIINALQAAGFDTEIKNSNAQDDQLRASLSLKGA